MVEEDLEGVLSIEEASFPHPWTREQFLEELRRQDLSRCVVAVLPADGPPGLSPGKEKVIGFLVAWLVADELHINNLAVAPGFRRSGAASGLLEHVLDQGREEGARWCQLEVSAGNTGAQALYGRFGFQVRGSRKGYYRNGEDAVVMAKEL